ncbi:MAG: hypothetical protein AAGB23_05310 [Pseudomonadota bacterium]
MKPGEGAAMCIYDITQGVPTETIKQRWQDGAYGPPGKRPRGEFVAGWLEMDGRKKRAA